MSDGDVTSVQEAFFYKCVLCSGGIDPDDHGAVVFLAVYGVEPEWLVAAARQVAETIGCIIECGNKLSLSDTDAMAIQLCPGCHYEVGLENEHSDGMHQHGKHPDCPDCVSHG